MTPYLYAHPNPNAPVRANGIRFHGYPGRSQKVRLIGLHTTESLFDLIGQDAGAENVAAYQSRTDRPSSYHRIVDRDTTVVCLPDEATAFGIGDLNSPTLHLSLAMRAEDWSDPAKVAHTRPMLERAADVAAEWSVEYGIPLTWLSRDAAFGTARGFIRHGTADPGRRSDPGRDFPAGLFFELVADRLRPPAPITEDDVFLFRNPDNGAIYLREGGVTVWINDPADVKALRAAGIPNVGNLTAALCDRLTKEAVR